MVWVVAEEQKRDARDSFRVSGPEIDLFQCLVRRSQSRVEHRSVQFVRAYIRLDVPEELIQILV
jgi:hypothetical protein